MPRPREPLRLSHSTANMAKPSKTWRNKSSKRKAEAKLTSSPPVRLPYMPAQAELKGMLVASYHILLGQAPTSHPFTLSQGASPVEQHVHPSSSSHTSAQAVPQAQKVASFPRPCGQHASGWDHIQGNLRRAPQLQMCKRSHLGTRYSSRATQKHSARTLTW